jgi:cobalt-precorrin 5A hydrolase
MIVAGLGFRRGVLAEEIEAVIAQALERLTAVAQGNEAERGFATADSVIPALNRKDEACNPTDRTLSHRERVGVRGSGLSIDQHPSPGASRHPLPMGEGGRRSLLLQNPCSRGDDITERGRQIELSALATLAEKGGEPGFVEAARRLGLPIIPCSREAMAQVANRIATRSARAKAAVGLPSVAEAAALVAAGASSRLLLPRVATAAATCAIAGGDAP